MSYDNSSLIRRI